jgi:hypothetical protein
VLVVALFLVTGIFQLPPVNGDGTINDNRNGTGDYAQEPGDGEVPVVPQTLILPTLDSFSMSDRIDLVVSTLPAAPGGFVPGIPVERGGGGANGNGDDDDDNIEPRPIFDAIVFVKPDPVPSPGIDIHAFGITNATSATYAIFELFGPECPHAIGVACSSQSSVSPLTPPSFTLPPSDGLCSSSSCEEYSVIFSGEHLGVKGEHHVKASFFDSDDNVVAIKGMNFRVHSFFVVPESQIGAIALILSSLGTVVLIYYVKARRR